MTTWYSKEIGDGVDAFAPSHEVLQAHMAHTLANEGTGGAAVFSRYDLHSNIVTLYFTPEAAALARQFNAMPVDKPQPGGRLGLLAGDGDALSAHFPNQPLHEG